ncbi:MAG: NAD(P)-dependent oxidoreductase [bacterium]|nr:NAD(P)-dependent oxidoreductase [bacterium]
MKKQKYLITGGLGLIGSRLANSLEGKVTVVSQSSTHIERLKRRDARLLIKPVEKLEKKDLRGIDVIYHLASTVDNYNILSDPFIDTDINIKGTTHLLELCRTCNPMPKIIYTSTFFVYGNEYDRTKKSLNEQSRTNPLSLYSATKLCTENFIKIYGDVYKVPYVIVRLANVYGEEDEYTNPKKGALNYMVMRAIQGEKLQVYYGGNFYRDYIYVDDAVSALKLIQDQNKELFLIAFGKSVAFKDLISFIIKKTQSTSIIKSVPPPPFHLAVGTVNFKADITKIKSLGWRPVIDYKKGLQKIINRYAEIANLKKR